MVRSRRAFTLLELAIAAFLLAALSIPLFDLLRTERAQVLTGAREMMLRAHALDRLATEAARLTAGTVPVSTRSITVDVAGRPLPVRETVTVTPVPGIPGLTSIEVALECGDTRRSISTFVPDRELPFRQPLTTPEALP